MAKKFLKIFEFSSKEDLFLALLDFIKKTAKEKKILKIALCGGNTPKPFYQKLGKITSLPWKNFEFYQTDERHIEAKHKESNQYLIRQTIVNPNQKKIRAAYFFDTHLSLEEAAQRYDKILKKKCPEGFDLCILGIGVDGHIASLFPHGKELQENQKFATFSTTKEFAIKNRLTITFPLISKSRHILVLLKGAEKKTVLEKLQKGKLTFKEFPAKKLLNHRDLNIFWVK